MSSTMGPLAVLMLSGGSTLVVALGLLVTLIALARRGDHRPAASSAPVSGGAASGTPPLPSRLASSRDSLRMAVVGLLLIVVIQVPFRLYLDLAATAPARFTVPLDRLIASLLLVALAVVLTEALESRPGRVAMATGLALPLLAWAVWAPIFSEAVTKAGAAPVASIGFTRPWDASIALGAVLLMLAMARRRRSLRHWSCLAPGLLAAGSLVDLWAPATLAGATGARFGQLAVALLLIITARSALAGGGGRSARVAESRVQRLLRRRERHEPDSGRARSRSTPPAPSPMPLAAAPPIPPTPEQQLGTVAIVHDALTELEGLGAATAVVMLRRGEDLETWASAPPGAASRLGRLSASRFKTVQRAMRSNGLTVHDPAEVRDLDSLYDQLGVPPTGPVRVEPIGARGVLLVGRAYGAWSPDTIAHLTRLAGHTAQRLAALERHGLDGNALDRMLGALEAQSASLDRVSRQVDRLAERVSHLEQPRVGPRPVAAEPAARGASNVPAERAFAARTRSLEQALGRAPWGVVLTEANGRVAFANDAACALLGSTELDGQPLAELTSDPESVRAVLGALRAETAAGLEGAAHARMGCDVGALRLDFESLAAPGLEAAGVMVILTPASEAGGPSESPATPEVDGASPAPTDPAAALVPELVDALREPMKAILTHRDVLTRRVGFADTELARHIGVVDAHLGRLDVRLADLLTGLELATGHYQLERGPLDGAKLLESAVMRARAQLEEKGLRIERRVGEHLPAVIGDRRALAHVLDNLLATAIDRSAHGAVITVGARLRMASQQSGAGAEPDILVFTVQYRDWWFQNVAERVFAIGDAEDATPALRVARILTEVQGGRAWGEQLGDDGRLLLNIGLPT